ncbi:MAG: hemolysin III family protein, partial [Planctomycetota bacterium]|nr:hemolysin III family protein [Planctomycetota bacterium]
GWGQVIAFGPLLWQLPNNVLAWILIGGLTYSLGYVFLTLDIRRYHFHTIWHIFVILGSACHYLAIWRWVTLA